MEIPKTARSMKRPSSETVAVLICGIVVIAVLVMLIRLIPLPAAEPIGDIYQERTQL